jgi:signal transduction histidine kinase
MGSRSTATIDMWTASPDSEEGSRAAALVTMLRLHWFIRLRWAFLAAAVVVLIVERLVVGEVRRPFGLSVVLLALAAVNLLWSVVSHVLFRQMHGTAAPLRVGLRPVVLFANAQVAVDLLLLTCILRFTGGVENPLAIFYLFHMAITALLLKRWQAALQGVWAVALYTGLVVAEAQRWLAPHWGLLPDCELGLYVHPHFVVVSALAVAFGVFGTLYFTRQIARRLEDRERELRAANAALRQSQTAIEDLQRRRSRFMQTAAHQLKSPLTVIQTLAELVRKDVVSREAIPETCEKIIRRCREGVEQVGELLTLARVQEADPDRHRRAETDIRVVIAELCERFEPLAQEKGISMSCDVPENAETRVGVDRQDLRDCLGNLIENAIKYTSGPGSVTVSLAGGSGSEAAEEVSITVTDTGIGVDPQILKAANGEPGHEAVFDAFRRGNNVVAAGIPGTGLGLSIVREIVEQAGGRIRVSSRPNEGSSFTVFFPARRPADEQPPVRGTRISEVVIEPPRGDQAQPSQPDDPGSR